MRVHLGISRVLEILPILLVGFAALFIGVSKAGLGGGLGMLTTPVCVMAFGMLGESPQFAIGFLLPLLILGDAASLYHYWHDWRADNLKFLLPGVAIGAWLGVQFIDRLEPHHFSLLIGLLAVGFVGWQFVDGKVANDAPSWQPTHFAGIPCGICTGLTSTFAHGAGPVVNLFLLPQKLSKIDYVATRVILFTAINWIKLPLFVDKDLVTLKSLKWGAAFCLLIPIGALLGVRLQRCIPERQFRLLIFILTLLAGIHLIISSLLPGKSSEERADSLEHHRIVPVLLPWKLSSRTCETYGAQEAKKSTARKFPPTNVAVCLPSGVGWISPSRKLPAPIVPKPRAMCCPSSLNRLEWIADVRRPRSSRSGTISLIPPLPHMPSPRALTREHCLSRWTATFG